MISFIIFVVGLCFKLDPISLATGITLLTAPYLTVETIKPSAK